MGNSTESKVLEVIIHQQLGFKTAWDKPKVAKTHFELACELTYRLDEQAIKRLASNPHCDLADHLYEFHEERHLELAKKAHEFGRVGGE